MKIVFYMGGFAPIGGIETFSKNLLCYLQSKNYDCRLVCWGQMSPLLHSIEQAQVKIFRTAWRWGCRWNVPDWILLPLGIQQVKQAEIILFNKIFPSKIMQQLRAKKSQKAVFIYITPYRPSLPKTTLEKKEVLEIIKFFDIILVQSSSFINVLHELGYQGRIEVIPLIPHQPGKLQPFPTNKIFKIGFLGRLVEDKNIPLLLKSFQCFQEIFLTKFYGENKENYKPTLEIFGDGHLRQELEKLSHDLGIKSSVIFHGNVSNDKIEAAIASCHLFAFTSRNEGQCLAALEILGCGRPIIATDAGALPDILSDSRLGRVVHSANPTTLANIFIETMILIEKNFITPEVIRAAYLERFAPEKVGNCYKELLDSLCK
ncbi:glycosyltransferase [Gloeothece verrucosa]|uniref:Glycosyl transferase group 1 n=1 Tax=Gloeothece verrucosa (strain PCC 7822) TaxID=497965 RepID=E0UKW4_GLOV7|nr:glycosyltransferase [Gloeothece verrucosa]ADN17594.1 glycosyl transferase group 1 [Gloeothece verrucosa PCC 7822]